jgi:hypothetical protein
MKKVKISQLELTIRIFLTKIKNIFFVKKGRWIMGRVACLGQDVYKLTGISIPLVNYQKARVDYINEISNKPDLKSKTIQVYKFIKRKDIRNLILQQEIFNFFQKPPIALYMDSYSELTDQRFVEKNKKWAFNANFSDISHNKGFKEKFKSLGLLEGSDLLESYNSFFKTFRRNYGSVPIIFIHFPVKLDGRDKFKLRYIEIKNAIDVLKNEFQPFYSLEVDEDIVDWPEENSFENEKFPYHYNQNTYKFLSDKVRKIRPFNHGNC